MRKMKTILVAMALAAGMLFGVFAGTAPVQAEAADISSYVKELIVYYKNYQETAQTDIDRVLDEMAKVDAEQAAVWEDIMDYWSYINTEMVVNIGTVPEGLPEDNSMAIVILGFALNADGTMKEELVGRLETGLAIAEAYPNSYVVVTGGGTAKENPDVTEGGLMGEWLLEQGLSEERLIVENTAPSTVGNAENTYKILNEQYPQVTSFVMVTSDYHVPRGCILFYSKCLLAAYELGGEPLELISNAGYYTGSNGYESISLQANGVSQVAGVNVSGVSVNLSELNSLKVVQNTMYQTGAKLDLSVTAGYSTGYAKDVTAQAVVEGFDAAVSAEQEVTVSYTENGITMSVILPLTAAEGSVVGTAHLEALIAEAEGISSSAYTKDSYAKLTAAIEEAKAVLEKTDLTIEDVDAAYAAITEAKENLVKKVNIARGMSVTANCNQGSAGKITNGTIGTGDYWASVDGGNVASADAEFIIDLDGTYDVDAIRVYPYWGGQRIYKYELFGSTDNENWFSIGINDSDEYITNAGVTHEMDVQISYVKLKGIETKVVGRDDINNIHIIEVEVYGEEPANIALHKPVISSGSDQSAASSSGATDKKINDGDRTTYWDAGLYANEPWAVIELGDVYQLDKINVITYWQRTRYYQYDLYASIDGETYTKIAGKDGTDNETVFGETFTFEEPVYAAYIKLVGLYDSGNSSFHLNEIRAYGEKAPADYTAVDEAIAAANALNRDYYVDFTAVDEAIAAVVEDLNMKDQAVVDAYAQAINDAVAALELKDADYSEVRRAIRKARKLNKKLYVDFGGVEAAIDAVEYGKKIDEQDVVDAYAQAIYDAIAALERKLPHWYKPNNNKPNHNKPNQDKPNQNKPNQNQGNKPGQNQHPGNHWGNDMKLWESSLDWIRPHQKLK